MISDVEKRARFDEARKSGVVLVHVDLRAFGVGVPAYLLAENIEFVRLNLGYRLGRRDLFAGDNGVSETLCFKGVWQPCVLPWTSIVALETADVEGKKTVWWLDAEKVPLAYVEFCGLKSPGPAPFLGDPKAIAREAARARLAVVPGLPPIDVAEELPTREPPRLRLVKNDDTSEPRTSIEPRTSEN